MKEKLYIISVPGMISKEDWAPLTSILDVVYLEKNRITWKELVDVTLDAKLLMLNYDVIKKLPAEFFVALKDKESKLEIIATDMTDMSWVDEQAAQENNIVLLNIPHYSTVSVAEFIIATALMHVKKIHLSLINGNKSSPFKNDTVYGKTIGIIGFGNIGSYTAKLAKGLGMKVLMYNRTPKLEVEYVQVSLETIFRESDIVAICLKTNQETTKIINHKVLKLAKKGQIIINQANGDLVDQDALYKVMKKDTVAGYSTFYKDVKNHPLIDLEQVSTFPSQAWFTDYSLQNLRKIWVENIKAAVNGSYVNQVL